jgi:hypothetical protein
MIVSVGRYGDDAEDIAAGQERQSQRAATRNANLVSILTTQIIGAASGVANAGAVPVAVLQQAAAAGMTEAEINAAIQKGRIQRQGTDALLAAGKQGGNAEEAYKAGLKAQAAPEVAANVAANIAARQQLEIDARNSANQDIREAALRKEFVAQQEQAKKDADAARAEADRKTAELQKQIDALMTKSTAAPSAEDARASQEAAAKLQVQQDALAAQMAALAAAAASGGGTPPPDVVEAVRSEVAAVSVGSGVPKWAMYAGGGIGLLAAVWLATKKQPAPTALKGHHGRKVRR